jgi:hypothetical protein
MYHMQATGVSGCDLWTRVDTEDDPLLSMSSLSRQEQHQRSINGEVWRWIGTHNSIAYPVSFAQIASNKILSQSNRHYMLYLPLYNAPTWMAVGVVPGSLLIKDQPTSTLKPIVWYGTSICQGACASRPGLAYTNYISRNVGRQIYNFGFSGNGQMEPEVLQYINEIDMSMFIVDCLPNMDTDMVTQRTEPLVKAIRYVALTKLHYDHCLL